LPNGGITIDVVDASAIAPALRNAYEDASVSPLSPFRK